MVLATMKKLARSELKANVQVKALISAQLGESVIVWKMYQVRPLLSSLWSFCLFVIPGNSMHPFVQTQSFWCSKNSNEMFTCPSDDDVADVLAKINITTNDGDSLLVPSNIAPSKDDDPTDKPKLKPSKAYTLVLGHRRLRVNSVKILQRAQTFQGEHS